MQLLWITILTAFCCKEAVSLVFGTYSQNFPKLKEFDYLGSVSDILKKKYNAYVHEEVSNDVQKEQKRQEFLSSFKILYHDASAQVYAMMKADDSKPLQAEVVEFHQKNYAKCKKFFDGLKKYFVDISNIKGFYLLETGQHSLAIAEFEFRKKALEEIESIINGVLKFLKDDAWKTQFIVDANAFLSNHQNSINVQSLLVKMLSQKYPSRSWLVVAYDNTVSANFCSSTSPIHIFSAGRGRTLVVAQTEKNFNLSKSFGLEMINRAASYKYTWFCKDESKEIVEEVSHDCKADKIPFLGVFMKTNSEHFSLPSFSSSSEDRVASRVVTRGSFTSLICRRDYSMIIFG